MNKIVVNGKSYFSFQSDALKDDINFYKLVNLKTANGYLINKDHIEKWQFAGYQNKDKPLLYGPDFDGISLMEVLSLPLKEALNYIGRFTKALNILSKKLSKIDIEIQLDSVYFLGSGEILFLPFEVMKYVRYLSSDEYKIKYFNNINHPYDNTNYSYIIGVLVYKILTGEYPYKGKTVEEINSKFRNMNIIPVIYKNPEIKNEISEVVTSFFNKKNINLNLFDWGNYILSWLEKDIFSGITFEQKQDLQNKSKHVFIKNEKLYRRKLFLENNKTKILITSGIILLFLLVFVFILKNYFRPRVTKGYTPEEVVETFYKSFNKLDHMTMSDCVINKAGREEINAVIRLYAAVKQSEVYTQKSNIIMADKWDAAGRKELKFPETVFGILNLNIKAENKNTFIVEYEIWQPIPVESEQDINNYEGFNIKDRVFLKKDRNDWVIYKINRLKKELITDK